MKYEVEEGNLGLAVPYTDKIGAPKELSCTNNLLDHFSL